MAKSLMRYVINFAASGKATCSTFQAVLPVSVSGHSIGSTESVGSITENLFDSSRVEM